MKQIFKNANFNCQLIINDDNTQYHLLLTIFNKGNNIEANFKIPKHCKDENKLDIIETIKKWYLQNKKGEYCKPKRFMNCINNELKSALRIREWKNLDELKKDQGAYYNSIDKFTEYIDNYKQRQEAEEHNKEMYEMIHLYDKVINRMKEIMQSHPDVQYSFGLYRYINNGKYEFEKINRY